MGFLKSDTSSLRSDWKNFLVYWAPPVLYAALIFLVSARSEFKLADRRLLVFDKAAHFFEYGILALLVFRALIHSRMRMNPVWKNALWAFAFVTLYAFTDEWHQSFVPNRHADVMDWLMDTLGGAFFLLPFMLPGFSDRYMRGTTFWQGVRSGTSK